EGAMAIIQFFRGSFYLITHGRRSYWLWLSFLACLIAVGAHGYVQQSRLGLIATHMRDQVSWAFYVGNFTFLVGVAAAAVLLVIPAYVYQWKPIKEVVPLVLLSIPVAISTHTVTAFLYNGMAARPYWNASILAPRFIASAFCSGPAVMLILFQILRRTVKLPIKDEAIWKIAELMAYAM